MHLQCESLHFGVTSVTFDESVRALGSVLEDVAAAVADLHHGVAALFDALTSDTLPANQANELEVDEAIEIGVRHL